MDAGMATAEQALDPAALGGADESAGGKRFSGKKLVILILLPLLLIGGVLGGLMATGIFNPFGGHADHGDEHAPAGAAEAKKKADSGPRTFHELPDMVINLNGTNRRTAFLKIKVALELDDAKQIDRITAMQPRIIDNLQVYLRELRVDDLRGSAGMARLREELLRRINASVEPVVVRDVLFKEMLVQ
jgi:flagellar FliL protein